MYGLHHEESKSNSNDEDYKNTKADEIIEKVLAKLDTNKDGVVTKREFLIAGNQALPNFEGIEGLGHHYNPEGEYWLHHEELYHNTPETQTDESYTHKEDLEHFAHHDEIEAEEDALVNKAQGLDEDGNPLPQKVLQAPVLTSVEKAKKAKADAARAYKMASAEASKQGPWPAGDFRKPKSKSDRLRAGMPYKYRCAWRFATNLLTSRSPAIGPLSELSPVLSLLSLYIRCIRS